MRNDPAKYGAGSWKTLVEIIDSRQGGENGKIFTIYPSDDRESPKCGIVDILS